MQKLSLSYALQIGTPMLNQDDEMEAALARLQLAIIAKPITSLPPVPTTDVKSHV